MLAFMCSHNHIIVLSQTLVRAFCFGDFNPKSLMSKSVLLMHSGWTSDRV